MHKYQHTDPSRPEHHPNIQNQRKYGKNIYYTEAEYATPPLNKDEIKELMGIVGSLLILGEPSTIIC